MSVINLSLPSFGQDLFSDSFQGRVDYIELNKSQDHEHTKIMQNMCDSNSSKWSLTTPVCSINFATFITFLTVAFLLAVITLLTIFGNMLVWVALYKFPNLRSMSNCLIGNLAMSDLLLALTVLPISAGNDLLGYWIFGKTMCIIWLSIDVLYCTASIWGLCTIAVDRFSATVFPVWYYDRKSPLRALVYIIFVWLFSIIVSLAPFIGWRDMIPDLYKFNHDINRYECVLFATEGYVVYSAMGSFVIPIILMTFLYARIFVVLRKRSKSLNARKKKMRFSFENDFDSVAIHEASSQLDLTNPVTMTDKATQISPVTRKEMLHNIQLNVYIGDVAEIERKRKLYHCDNNQNGRAREEIPLPEIVLKRHPEKGTPEEKVLCLNENNKGTNIHVPLPNGNNQHLNVIDKVENHFDNRSVSPSKSTKSFDDPLCRKTSQKEGMDRRNSSIRIKSRFKRQRHSGIKTKYELREQRATKRMAIVMACFLVCWMPFLFMYIIRSFCTSCSFNVHIQASIIWLGYANSGINPILYTLFNDDFRKAFKLILGFKVKQKRFPS